VLFLQTLTDLMRTLMNTGNPIRLLRKATASALLATLLLLGCGGEKPETMLNSAKTFLEKNEHKTAAIQLKNALQKDPQLAEARFLLAKALLEGGDPTGAEVELRKAQGGNYPAEQVNIITEKERQKRKI